MHGSLWFSCYLLTGSAIVVQYVREAYFRAVDVCEMYPSFDFGETLREELWDHTTLLPVVHRPVVTLMLLLLYALAYVVMRFNVIELAWLLLVDMLSGRWIHHALFVTLPAYVPFLASEPGVPELLSDDDDNDDATDAHDQDATAAEFRAHFGDDAAAAGSRVSARECHRALAKLAQVKRQFADCRIERPDDWLVFDPLEAELVPQKNVLQQRRAELLLGAAAANATATTIQDRNATSAASKARSADPQQVNGFAASPLAAAAVATTAVQDIEQRAAGKATLEPEGRVGTGNPRSVST